MAEAQVVRAQEEAFLDAAERLLLELGYPAVTTRRVAAEAGLNHGLVHYYFGSVENLLVRVLERFTERLTARQRAMYADPEVAFIEKWRQAMRYLVGEDVEYEKVWLELQAVGWNHPEVQTASRGSTRSGEASSPRHSPSRGSATGSRCPSRRSCRSW